jgi:hypothetical protein
MKHQQVLIAAILIAMGLMAPYATLRAQSAASDSAARPADKVAATPAPQTQSKLTLLDATRVSTDEAIKEMHPARMPTAKPDGKQKGAKTAASKLESLPASDVVELQSVSHAAGTLDPFLVDQKDHSKSPLKNVHGDLYGATDSGALGGNQVDGAVGATTKSGKTSVYVQTDHAQTTWPH